MKKTVLAVAFNLIGFWASAQVHGLSYINSFGTGAFDEAAAEILSYDSLSQQLYFSNALDNSIGILDVSDLQNPVLQTPIDLSPYGGGVNSVLVADNYIAVAVEDTNKQDSGRVVFFDMQAQFLNSVTVGALPDMICLSPDGMFIVSANEGEPNDDYTVDPNGSVSIIDMSAGATSLSQAKVVTLDFSAFTMANIDSNIRIFGNNGLATVAQDMEPEYIAIHPNSQKAYVVCQENNAVAIVDLVNPSILSVKSLGFKDHSISSNGFDASDKDSMINISTQPVLGMYMPDAIKMTEINGQVYLFTANEGDSRDYDGYSEEVRVEDLLLDSVAYPNAAALQDKAALGRLKTTTANGDYDGDGDVDQIFSYGARSFSIWDENLDLVFDSGDDFEAHLALEYPNFFNSTNDDNDSQDNRSDDKGPEPEAIELAKIGNETYAFIGMERMGGIFVYDVSNPQAPVFVDYFINRNFAVDADSSAAGDLGPEDIVYAGFGATSAPTPVIFVANEVSGSVGMYAVENSVGINESNTPSVEFFPNPATDEVQFNQTVRFELFDLQGRVLLAGEGNNLNIAGLSSGVYQLKINGGRATSLVKL